MSIKNVFYGINPNVGSSITKNVRIPAPFAQNGTKVMYLTPDFDIIHVSESKVYKRDKTIPLSELAYTVPDLAVETGPVSLVILLAHIFKPLRLPQTVYKRKDADGKYNGPKVKVVNGEFRPDPKFLFWQWPTGGIESTTATGKFYVPGVEDLLISEAGLFFQHNGTAVNPGPNRTTLKVKTTTDPKVMVELPLATASALAFGMYNENTFDSIVELSDPSTGPTKANIMRGFTSVTGTTSKVKDHPEVIE